VVDKVVESRRMGALQRPQLEPGVPAEAGHRGERAAHDGPFDPVGRAEIVEAGDPVRQHELALLAAFARTLHSVMVGSADAVSSCTAVIRVFVIEDTPQMRLLLEQMLTLDNFEVVGSAANGAAALSELNRADPDVVVLDYNMPGLDGLLTARLIKEERPGQAIILYSAYLDTDLEEKAARAGIALCVEKADGILTLERDIRRLAARSE
jgi:CheY-like chemotaxis protein